MLIFDALKLEVCEEVKGTTRSLSHQGFTGLCTAGVACARYYGRDFCLRAKTPSPGRITGQLWVHRRTNCVPNMKGARPWQVPLREKWLLSPKYLFSKGRRRDFPRGQLHLFRIQGCQFCESCLHMIHSACSVRLRWDSRSQDGMNKIMLCNTGHHSSRRTGCLSCPPTRRCSPGRHRHRKP